MKSEGYDSLHSVDKQCMNLTFKEDKAIAALSQLCHFADNKLNHYTAAKLLYLFDREVLLYTGEPAFFGTYFSLPKGPIISEVNNGISSCGDSEVDLSYDWSTFFTLNRKTHLISQKNPDERISDGLLSDEEIDRLRDLYSKYHLARKGMLEGDIKNLPEHIDLNKDERRRALTYRDILEKNGFTPKQASEILQEIVYDDCFRSAFELSF